MNIMLKRGGLFQKLIIMVPEGLGIFTNRKLTKLVGDKWNVAGKHGDWLFCVCGKKEIHPDKKMVVMDNLDTNQCCQITSRKEFTMLYDGLRQLGISATQIVFESESNNTYEQALNVKRLFASIAEKPLLYPCPITIVCNDIHAYRVRAIFNRTSWYTVDQVWTVRYNCDRSNPLNCENWFHYLPRPLYQVAEAAIIWRDKRRGLLP